MFEVRFKKSVKKDLQKLSKTDQKQVLTNLQRNLAKDPFRDKALSRRIQRIISLAGRQPSVIYEIQNKQLIVLVLKIGDCKDVYR